LNRDYHRILGLTRGASESEIKKAYREKAKMYHPDRNKHPRAAEAFVLVNEAYEMLLNPSSIKEIGVSDEDRKRYYGASRAGKMTDEERREAARRRAEANSKKTYEAFMNSPIYKTAMVFSRVLDFVAIFFSMVLIFSPFVAFFMTEPDKREEAGIYGMFSLAIIGGILLFGYWKYMWNQEDKD